MLDFDTVHTYDSIREAVFFRGLDGKKIVPCYVSREALSDKARLRSATQLQLISVYHQHVARIRKLASDKYAAGAVEADGAVIVKTADLN